jgi:hypothetical protein
MHVDSIVCTSPSNIMLHICLSCYFQKNVKSFGRENGLILGNNQLDALFHVFICFMSLHVSSAVTLETFRDMKLKNT